jgi:branched-chain amino acid transport system substrate-binding protein
MKERMLRVGIVRALVAAGILTASGLISQTALAEEPIKIGWL